jgi:hypothetical protein
MGGWPFFGTWEGPGMTYMNTQSATLAITSSNALDTSTVAWLIVEPV